jgi:hypothetical protein
MTAGGLMLRRGEADGVDDKGFPRIRDSVGLGIASPRTDEPRVAQPFCGGGGS